MTERPQWFDDLLVKYTPFLLKQCAFRTNDPEDLMQDVRLYAMVKWRQYKKDFSFPSWLRYLVMSVWRERCSKIVNTVELNEEHDVPMPASQEHRADINLALRLCTPRQRDIVLMYSSGFLHREIAESLGVSRIWAMKLFQEAQELVAVNTKAAA